jgi:hypothetical protein
LIARFLEEKQAELGRRGRVVGDGTVLFAYKFASGLDTSRAGTRRMIFFLFPFLSTDSLQPTAHPSRRRRSTKKEDACCAGGLNRVFGGFEPNIKVDGDRGILGMIFA